MQEATFLILQGSDASSNTGERNRAVAGQHGSECLLMPEDWTPTGSRKVGCDASQVTGGSCVQCRRNPLVQFLSREPTLGEGVAEPGGRALPVAVGDPHTVICCPARLLMIRPGRGSPGFPAQR